MSELQIVSVNVRGLRGDKRHTICRWLLDNKYDIALLQETYCTESFVDKCNKGWNGEILHSVSDSSHSRGVYIMFNKNLKYKIIDYYHDNLGRFIIVNIEIDGIGFTIVNVYAPNNPQERSKFFAELKSHIDSHALFPTRLLFGGDCNSVISTVDRVSHKLDGSSTQLNKLVQSLEMYDVWRCTHQTDIEFTYIDPSDKMRNSRIDLWLCSNSLKSILHSSCIKQAPAPDHKAIEIYCLKMPCNTRGKGCWKMNASILEDKEYVDSVTSQIQDAIHEYKEFVSKSTLWEYIKLIVKEHAIKYSIARARDWKDKIAALELKLDQIDQNLAQNNSTELQEERNMVKMSLDSLYKAKSRGYQIRSRARWVELGETSSPFFL